jgi:hypothetical protein
MVANKIRRGALADILLPLGIAVGRLSDCGAVVVLSLRSKIHDSTKLVVGATGFETAPAPHHKFVSQRLENPHAAIFASVDGVDGGEPIAYNRVSRQTAQHTHSVSTERRCLLAHRTQAGATLEIPTMSAADGFPRRPLFSLT